MTTFLLVHGAWGSGWQWHRVTPLLIHAGHATFAPTLTGLGERAHLLTRQTGLETHIQDIVSVIEYEDLQDVVLVGWSYGGAVATGAANRVPERIARLAYLDGVAPAHGESCRDLAPDPDGIETLAQTQGDGWLIPPPAGANPERVRRSRPQPYRAWIEPVQLDNPTALMIPRTYLYCVRRKPPEGLVSARRAQAAGWDFRELDAGHMAPLDAPEIVVSALLDLA